MEQPLSWHWIALPKKGDWNSLSAWRFQTSFFGQAWMLPSNIDVERRLWFPRGGLGSRDVAEALPDRANIGLHACMGTPPLQCKPTCKANLPGNRRVVNFHANQCANQLPHFTIVA